MQATERRKTTTFDQQVLFNLHFVDHALLLSMFECEH